MLRIEKQLQSVSQPRFVRGKTVARTINYLAPGLLTWSRRGNGLLTESGGFSAERTGLQPALLREMRSSRPSSR